MKEVLQKIIATSGLASRREAGELIKQGSVKLNGRRAVLGDRAELGHDLITVKGRPLAAPQSLIYLKFNKPAGYTCTNRSFVGEKNIFELIPFHERLFSIGRLDKDSRGLILLTNDGALTQKLAHPRFRHEKTYRILIGDDKTAPIELKLGQRYANSFMAGVDIGLGDGIVKAKRAQYLQSNVFIITLSEGKKRQIRRMFATFNLKIKDLQRINFAGLKLDDLPEGEWRKLSVAELKMLSYEK